MLKFNAQGIYCEQADIYIDPWLPVEKAIITHAHADHARRGNGSYLCHRDTLPFLYLRLGADIRAEGIPYHRPVIINGVTITLYPAGHITGSAQVRLEYKGEIWVVSGDYKLQPDPTCVPFEPVKCHHFVTESTFGLPVYHFPEPESVHADMNEWWRRNAEEGRNSVLSGYSLGKAQRILYGLDAQIGHIYLHGAIANVTDVASQMLNFPEASRIAAGEKGKTINGALIIAPPSATDSAWMLRFEPYSLGVCSGWMQLRGARRRRNADRGFVLSDHCDWEQLNTAVKSTGAEHIYVTHGYQSAYARWLREAYGLDAQEVQTLYEGEKTEEEEVNGTT